MSVYGHYNTEYFSSMNFPEQSFTIAGIKYYNDNAKHVVYDDELQMKYDVNNKYDSGAIAIYNKESQIGYVPNKEYYKKICNENIRETLKIINIKSIKGQKGIRVIPERFYDESLIKEAHFVD